MIGEEVKSKFRRLMELRQAKDEAEEALKTAKEEFRELESEIIDAMDEDGVEGSLKINLGGEWGSVAFRTRETDFARVVDDTAAHEWFETRGQIEEVSSPRWARARLNEIVRNCREQGLPLPPGLDYTTNRGITITRQK